MHHVKYSDPILTMLFWSYCYVILRSDFIAENNEISTCLCKDMIQWQSYIATDYLLYQNSHQQMGF